MTARRPRAPIGLGKRGAKLWAELVADGLLHAGSRVLAEEACRIADRLEALDGLLRGKRSAWARIKPPREWSVENADGDFVLQIDGLLIESRQQANALRQIVATLDSMKPKDTSDEEDPGADL